VVEFRLCILHESPSRNRRRCRQPLFLWQHT
jgi:hypothetical protein